MYRTAAVLFGLLGLVFAAGCASDQDGGSALTAPIEPAALSATTTAWALVGPAGGVLSTGGVTLAIPAGAIAAPTGVSLAVTQDSGVREIALEPLGLALGSEAVLTIQNAAGSALLELDSATGEWVDAGPAAVGLALRARIINLSKYEVDTTD